MSLAERVLLALSQLALLLVGIKGNSSFGVRSRTVRAQPSYFLQNRVVFQRMSAIPILACMRYVVARHLEAMIWFAKLTFVVDRVLTLGSGLCWRC